MKNFTLSVLAFLSIMVPVLLFGNTIIVKGYVKSTDNKPVAGKIVKIAADSTNQLCLLTHTVTTNANGYYSDTLTCNGDIRKLRISVENCNGGFLVNEPQLTTGTYVIESNFTVCVPGTSPPTPTNCKAWFSYTFYPNYPNTSGATAVKFRDASALPSGDSIISRTWSFGDSTAPLTGNRIDPSHQYIKPGTYNACLTIKTKKGCESKYCTTLAMQPIPVICLLQVHVSVQKTGVKKIRFNSSLSKAQVGDSIISRTWKFGDGSTLGGNEISPLKEYRDTGIYTACVKIKTAKGCEKDYCITLFLRDTNPSPPRSTNCKAYFSHTSYGNYPNTAGANIIKFKDASVAPAGDSIISRTWSFGDSTALLTGNRIDPSHQYTKPGTYNACLTIKTKKGCESKYCATVVVVPIPAICKAYFSHTPYPNYTKTSSTTAIKFNDASAAPAGDSIVQRTWSFGDSTEQLTGNRIDPSHQYTKPGTYNACLMIKTKKGCESKYCATVVVLPILVICQVQAHVSAEKMGIKKIRFNSSLSKAQAGDSIIQHTWKFGDGSALEGNEISPLKEYKDTGIYTVCVNIKTAKGCEKEYCITLSVRDTISSQPRTNCKAYFSHTPYSSYPNTAGANAIKFNDASASPAGDSIISRAWSFGDSTAPLTGNRIDPSHQYPRPGTYYACLAIKTKMGCESKYCSTILINLISNNCELLPQFNAERIKLRTERFNSSMSTVQKGDSIIQRKWYFGNGTILDGNEISPVKEYAIKGVYTVCLNLKTAKGCKADVCKQVIVEDSTGVPPTNIDQVKIISINPNPVITRLTATVWSRNNNVQAEISIFDIHGIGKLSTKKMLVQGNNVIEIATESLPHDLYFLKVSTKNSRESRIFYKF